MSMEGLFHRLSALQWFERSQALIPWVNTLFVLSLAYLIAGVAWRAWPLAANGAGVALIPVVSSQLDSHSRNGAGLDSVATMHLLGKTDETIAAPVSAVIDAPETRLSLTLKGIIALSAGTDGRALIAEGSAAEKIYQVGDSLSGGAILHEVLADKVILKRGGRFETLTLPRDRADVSTPSQARRSPTAGRSVGTMSRQLRTLRDDVASNPQKAFGLIQAQPVMEGGKMKGYRVSPGKERRLFQGTGLRAGDVVTSVNGISVADPAQMATLFAQFKSANSFNLMVERGGRQSSFTIDLGK